MARNMGKQIAVPDAGQRSGRRVIAVTPDPEMQLRSNRTYDRARTGFGYRLVYGNAVACSVSQETHGGGYAWDNSVERRTAVALRDGRRLVRVRPHRPRADDADGALA